MRNAVLFSLLVTAGTVQAHAQEPGSRQTREFVQAASQSDQFEILEAQTALTQSKDDKVRAFARQMITDHTATSQALQQAVATSGLKPPPKGISEDQAHLLGSLQSMRGHDFDRAYFRQQALAHRSALTVEQAYAASGDDRAVRQAAASATPVIAQHLQMADQMVAQAGAD